MKVMFPGPSASSCRGPQYFPFLKVTLVPGENEVPDSVAKQLLALGIVRKVEEILGKEPETSTSNYDYHGPIPTEDTLTKKEE